jgi:hypothetical protein
MKSLRRLACSLARSRCSIPQLLAGVMAASLIESINDVTRAATPSPGMRVCVRYIAGDPTGLDGAFAEGPINIPNGTVFDYAGHAFGPASDPIDEAHETANLQKGWTDVTAAENKRREKLQLADTDLKNKQSVAVVTTAAATLTKRTPCGVVPIALIVSNTWGWDQRILFGNSNIYFQAYGVIRGEHLETDMPDQNDPFEEAVAGGILNGIVIGTVQRVINLPEASP